MNKNHASMFAGMSDAQIAHAVRSVDLNYQRAGLDPYEQAVSLSILRDLGAAAPGVNVERYMALETLKSVLCDPIGAVVSGGSDADRALIAGALDVLTQPAAPAAGAILTNPHTGQPRDYRDVESDPEGKLIVNPGEPLWAASTPSAPVEVIRDDDGEIVMVKQGGKIIASTCHAGGKRPAASVVDPSRLGAAMTAFARKAEAEAKRPPAPDDRGALLYLMSRFDAETWQCPKCGHDEDTATMDSADYLRRYLAENPAEDAVATAPAPFTSAEQIQEFVQARLGVGVRFRVEAVGINDFIGRAEPALAPGIDLEPLIGIRNRLHQMSAANDLGDGWADVVIELMSDVQKLIDASPKGGSEALSGELRVWGTYKPGMMPKLFGDRDIAELNWYPEEGSDLICLQIVERVQAQPSDAEVKA